MNKNTATLVVVIASALLFSFVSLVWGFGVYNDQASLKTQYEMKVAANSATFDNTWKVISQSAQVAESQKDALREIFEGYASARTGTSDNSNRVMTWIKESVPNADLATYRNLQNIVVGSRDSWTRNQLELVEIARQYNLNLSVIPRGLLLKVVGFTQITPKVITSTRTERVFESGKDDEVTLFTAKKK